jgi:hypothetical protein
MDEGQTLTGHWQRQQLAIQHAVGSIENALTLNNALF